MKDAQTALALADQQTAIQPITPMSLIEMAAARGASIEQMAQLFDLKLRVEADEARKAFVQAMAAFKGETIRIRKDKENTQYTTAGKASRYVSLGNLVGTVTPFLSKHGLSARWDVDQSAGIKVTCIVTHAMGHSESVSMLCPPDKSGSKNPIQEIKSSITYAKVCTFESICGLASIDGNLDDDGNGSGKHPEIPEQAYVAHMDNIQNAGSAEELKRLFAAAYEEARKTGDKDAMAAFIKAKDNRKAELAR